MKTELVNIALEGTHNREVMGGFCEPGKTFRRFCLEGGNFQGISTIPRNELSGLSSEIKKPGPH